MQGKSVVITGPTAGIGKQVALGLAARGARLIFGCRDLERGRRAADEVRRVTAAAAIEVLEVDTSSQRSIRAFARAVRDANPTLDVLVNNAGISEGERKKSVDGIELTFATNVLGYFLLTDELSNLLRASAPARIVNVASQFAGDLDLDDVEFVQRPYDGLKAYAQSKACDRLLTWALARRLEGTGVTANAYAPGFVPGTELSRGLPAAVREDLQRRPGRTTAEGADTAVWLASSAEVEGVTGRFFMDRRELPCAFRDEAVEERLWSICARLVGGRH